MTIVYIAATCAGIYSLFNPIGDSVLARAFPFIFLAAGLFGLYSTFTGKEEYFEDDDDDLPESVKRRNRMKNKKP